MPVWQKGQSGNPKGRAPRGQAMADQLRKLLRAKDADGRTNREKVATAVLEVAIGGNIEAAKLIFERIDGKVADHLDVESDNTIHVVVTYADR